jgi:CRP-like cAMP-binding protein
MPSFHINNVALLKEKKHHKDKENLICVADYRGVLLRDILEKAGMEYIRKWEPGVYVCVRGSENKDVVFSFGEIFYSSIGRSIILAYEKDGKPIHFSKGCGELIVATDVRDGRRVREHIQNKGKITLSECKDLLGTGRVVTLTILEYLDSIKSTLRVGDHRVLFRGE